jgi:chromosome segregation ATPase
MIRSPRSPQRVRVEYTDPTAEKAEHYYSVYSGRAHAEILASVAQQEKEKLVASALNVQSALRGANDNLSEKQRLLQDAQRDVATYTVERTKLLSNLAASRSSLEEEIMDQRRQMESLQATIRKCEEECQVARQKHFEAHHHIEQQQRAVSDMSTQVKQVTAGIEILASDQVSALSANKVQATRFQDALYDKEGNLEKLLENIRQIERIGSEADAEHAAHVDKLRRSSADLRVQIQEVSKRVDVARSRLSLMESEEEEANRRRRISAEESNRQEASERKALLQELQGKKEEAARRFRAQSASVTEKLRIEGDEAIKEQNAARVALSDAFEEELRLHEALRQVKNDLIGIEALTQRTAHADAAATYWNDRCGALESEVAYKQSLQRERQQQIESLRAQTAPLADVESAISSHTIKIASYHKAKADLEAERALAQVRRSEREDADSHRKRQLQQDIREAMAETQRHNEDVAQRCAALESDIRQMEAEKGSLTQNIQLTLERNQLLDQTLEHIFRQRRAMAEELAHRRDAARLAAQTLLAQLE